MGKFSHDKVKRGRPTFDKFNKWKKSFLDDPVLDDYDVYLWGSWPEKENTWDIDIIVTKGDGVGMTTAEMEELALLNFEKSLVENEFFADIGFTDEPIINFGEAMKHYKRTGKKIPNSGYVYANEWYADDKKVKTRSDWKGPSFEELQDNMMKIGTELPYHKQLNNMDKFESHYANKPVLIKPKKKR